MSSQTQVNGSTLFDTFRDAFEYYEENPKGIWKISCDGHRLLPSKKVDEWSPLEKLKLETFEVFRSANDDDVIWVDTSMKKMTEYISEKFAKKYEDNEQLDEEQARHEAEAESIIGVYTTEQLEEMFCKN
jgi:hypothetical protein